MRAVNLIPGDQRGGASVGAGRSEGAAYAVLAALVVVAVLALLYGKATREVSTDKSKAATLSAEAAQAQAQATALAPYTTFVALREQREQAVASLVDSRFDWAHAFHEFGRVLSNEVSISSLSGAIGTTGNGSLGSTPAPGTASGSATPPGSVPTFTLSGCATSQKAVADTLQRLRLIDGVSEVTLQSSTRGSSGSGSGGAGSCPTQDPVFQMTISFDALPSASASAAAAKAKPTKTVAEETTTSGGKAG